MMKACVDNECAKGNTAGRAVQLPSESPDCELVVAVPWLQSPASPARSAALSRVSAGAAGFPLASRAASCGTEQNPTRPQHAPQNTQFRIGTHLHSGRLSDAFIQSNSQ